MSKGIPTSRQTAAFLALAEHRTTAGAALAMETRQRVVHAYVKAFLRNAAIQHSRELRA